MGTAHDAKKGGDGMSEYDGKQPMPDDDEDFAWPPDKVGKSYRWFVEEKSDPPRATIEVELCQPARVDDIGNVKIACEGEEFYVKEKWLRNLNDAARKLLEPKTDAVRKIEKMFRHAMSDGRTTDEVIKFCVEIAESYAARVAADELEKVRDWWKRNQMCSPESAFNARIKELRRKADG